MKIRVDKIASVVYRLRFNKEVEVSDEIESANGTTIVVRALREKRVYRELELSNGRMSTISKGDVIVGALGKRRALRGFSGDVPSTLRVGDTVEILNRGGVLGESSADHKDLGRPLACEVLGMPVRNGAPVRLSDSTLPRVDSLQGLRVPPLTIVSGTSMGSGKTYLLATLVHEAARRGVAVAGGKVTGIACLRDLVALEDHGARRTASFLDVGYPSTVELSPTTTVEVAKTVIAHLVGADVEAIFLELGDGILGRYGVMDVLTDPEIRAATKAHLLCAGDPVGAWGAYRYLEQWGVDVDVFSGPVTDNEVGVGSIAREVGRPAINAYRNPEEVGRVVLERLGLPHQSP